MAKLEQFVSHSSEIINRSSVLVLVSLIDAIFLNISIEKSLYEKISSNNAVEERLEKASHLLRVLIIKIKDSKINSKFKLKHYFSMIKSITQILTVRSTGSELHICTPVALNLSKILNLLLELNLFKLHLSEQDKVDLFNFLIKGSRSIVSDLSESLITKNKVLVEFLSSLILLCFHEKSSPPVFLNSIKNNSYLKIISLVTAFYNKVFLSNKKESLLLILIFRIINNSLINLSTLEIGKCHTLMRIGIRCINGIKFLTYENLKEQFLILINIIPLFINLFNFPRQIGDIWALDAYQKTLPDELQVPESSSEFSIDQNQKQVPSEMSKYLLELAGFIEKLFKFIMSSDTDFRLAQEEIHLKVAMDETFGRSWFEYRQFNLKRNSRAEIGWLFRSGTLSILLKYFQLRDSVLNFYDSYNPLLDSGGVNKKRKLQSSIQSQSLSGILLSSSNVLNFLFSIVEFISDDKLAITGYQVLTFVLSDHPKVIFETGDSNSFLKKVIKSFELQNTQITFWALLCLRVVIPEHMIQLKDSDNIVKDTDTSEILKFALDFVKVTSLSDVACSLASSVLQQHLKGTNDWQLENVSLKQLESLLFMHDVYGPATLSRQTMYFWFRIYDVTKAVGFKSVEAHGMSKNRVHDKIYEWFLSKWEQIKSLSDLEVLDMTPVFISWLCGSQNLTVDSEQISEKQYIYNGHLMLFSSKWYRHKDLRSSIILEEATSQFSKSSKEIYQLEVLPTSQLRVEALLGKILKLINENQVFYDNNPQQRKLMIQWAFSLLRIYQNIKSLPRLDNFTSSLIYQAKVIIESFIDNHLPKSDSSEFLDFLKLISQNLSSTHFVESVFHPSQIDAILHCAFKHLDRDNAHVSGRPPLDITDDFEGFAKVKRSATPIAATFQEESEFGIYELEYSECFEQLLIELIMLIGLSSGVTPEKLTEKCGSAISKFKSGYKVQNALYFLWNAENGNFINSLDLSCETVSLLIRIYAERLLSDFYFERSELTIEAGCQLLEKFFEVWCTPEKTLFKQDCTDIANFVIKIVESELVLTELSVSSYLRLIFCLSSETQFDEYLSTSLEIARNSNDNNILVSFTDQLVFYMSKHSNSTQATIYNALQALFPSPQESVESAATYCYFIGAISKNLYSSLAPGIFNLIELASFEHFRPYIKCALGDCCRSYSILQVRDILEVFGPEIFKFWLTNNLKISDFPIDLFGYSLFTDFVEDLHVTMVATSFAIGKNQGIEMTNFVLKFLQCSSSDVLLKSFSQIIVLSFAAKKMRYLILDIMKDCFKSEASFIDRLRSSLPSIVSGILKITDVTSTTSIRQCFKQFPDTKYSASLFIEKTATLAANAHISISPSSTLDLISKVIERLGEPSNFWSYPLYFFLVSRSILEVKKSISKSETVINLRRLEFLIAISSVNISRYELLSLIAQQLSQLISSPEVTSEICSILLTLWSNSTEILNPKLYIPSFITVLSKLIVSGIDFNDHSVHLLLLWMKEFIETHPLQTATCIITSALSITQNLPPKLSISEIESVLLLDRAPLDYDEDCSLFSLLSVVFNSCPHLANSEYANASAIVAKRLFNQDNSLSDTFTLWRGRYLGDYYSQNGTLFYKRKDSGSTHLYSIYESDFGTSVSTMDNIFREVLGYKGSDVEILNRIDYLIGAIIWRNENVADDKLYIRYNENFQKYEHRTLKMDFQVYKFLVLEERKSSKVLHSRLLGETIRRFDKIVEESDEDDDWITTITISILNELLSVTTLVRILSTFVTRFPQFSNKIFQHVVLFYVHSSKGGGLQICDLIRKFYQLQRKDVSKQSKRTFVELVLLLRMGDKLELKEYSTTFKEIDLKSVYHDALEVGFPEAALMIMESFFSSHESERKVKWQEERQFLIKVYNSLDEADDLVYGLPVEPTLSYGASLVSRGVENSWNQILLNSGLLDTSLATGGQYEGVDGMMKSMLGTGFNGLSKALTDSGVVNSGSKDDLSYEWAWKLNQWDIPVSKSSSSEKEVIYKTFKLINDNDKDKLKICQEGLIELVTNKVRFLEHEDSKGYLNKLRDWLRSLSTIRTAETIMALENSELVELSDKKTSLKLWYKHADFDSYENILIARRSSFEVIANSQDRNAWVAVLSELSLYGQLARSNLEVQKSINSAVYFDKLLRTKFDDFDQDLKDFIQASAKFQIASIFWDQGQAGFSVATLQEMIKSERKNHLTRQGKITPIIATSQLQLGTPYLSSMIVKWASESRQVSSSSIMDTYLETISSEKVDSVSQQAEIYHHFAAFCDLNLKDPLIKADIQRYSKLIATKEMELLQLKDFREDRRNSKEDRDAAKSKYARIYRMRAQDKEELRRLKENRARFVINAVKFYLNCIAIDDEYDDTDIDRFCGIWLEYSESNEVNDVVDESIVSVANYKFITWISQLMSRLADELTTFQYILTRLLEQLSQQHPFHTLYLIKSLRLHLNIASNDKTVDSRALAADKLWRRLIARSKTYTEQYITAIEQLCEASCEVASERLEKSSHIKVSSLKTGKFWLQSLPSSKIPPPTRDISVDKNADYSRVPYIVATSSNISVASSGISLPKIMTFKLSNGETHKMLLKGGSDDLRQDAIMEQVFEKVNNIFQNYKETRRRNLRIRTYKVVPLGPQAGVIEFVRNSIALNDVLKPLHEKQDKLKLDGARSLMKKVQKASLNERIKTYYVIMDKVKPVMRTYFFNNFLNPQEWYQSKIMYTRGISVTSFVGYILGLGDRHSNNILLDNRTGEPIHIDLGVSFDQGKRLPIPETVPFRLTRDIVDGFGITGVEGCFIKSSEHVMRILRLETERIMDILNILKYDPLYSWTLSPIRKQKLQEQGDMINNQDIEATDAIEGVRKKLISSNLSIEATVRELTQEAMDPDRLALIYMGWSPFY